jgi:hypothetical protein
MESSQTDLEQAKAEYLAGHLEAAGRILDRVTDPAPVVRGMLALCRVRLLLVNHRQGQVVDGPALAGLLEVPVDWADLAGDQAFAMGWLAWQSGELDRAERHLIGARELLGDHGRRDLGPEADYWLAWMELSRRHPEALASFEVSLRRWGGGPQMTGWYVDLLWRAGQQERAAQVWQTVRHNPRIAAIDEAPLLEGRFLLWQGQSAEQVLAEARCRGGVVETERCLLLAWLLSARNEVAGGDGWLRKAEAGFYPAGVLRAWRTLFNLRHGIQPGTEGAWLLHHAARAQVHQDFGQAGRWLSQALQADPDLKAAGDHAEKVKQALPVLEERALAQSLARVACFHPDQPALPGELLEDAVRLLQADPRGQSVLVAVADGKGPEARQRLEALANQEDLLPRLVHHLALLFHRAACYGEGLKNHTEVQRCWQVAWQCWVRVLGSLAAEGRLTEAHLLLTRLLDLHREWIGDYLAQDRVDAARRHWATVESLSALVHQRAQTLVEFLAERVTRFRDELVTAYLTATREVMKSRDIAPGWRADYDRGLSYIKRLLSLDSANVRLLTALVEICADWFLDCYNNEEPKTLWRQVERFTPFALKLARLVEARPGELAARAALAEFFKYRGFIAADRSEKMALYREAARLDPGNENVQMLLAEIERAAGAEPGAGPLGERQP